MNIIVLSPAYGRDYKSKKEIMQDWNANKDFRVRSFNVRGSYANKSSLAGSGYTHAEIRYSQDRKVTMVKL